MAFASLLFVACGDDSSSNSSNEDSALSSYDWRKWVQPVSDEYELAHEEEAEEMNNDDYIEEDESQPQNYDNSNMAVSYEDCYANSVRKCNSSHIGATGSACGSSECCRTSAKEYCSNAVNLSSVSLHHFSSSSGQTCTVNAICEPDWRVHLFFDGKSVSFCEGKIISDEITNDFIIDNRDGQTYKTLTIKKQIWMAEDLKYALDTNTYCADDYNHSCSKILCKDDRGCIYPNNYEIKKIICPVGWRIPSKSDWETLLNYATAFASEGTSCYRNQYSPFLLRGKWDTRYMGYPGTDDYFFADQIGFNVIANDYIYYFTDKLPSFYILAYLSQNYVNGEFFAPRESSYVRCIKD